MVCCKIGLSRQRKRRRKVLAEEVGTWEQNLGAQERTGLEEGRTERLVRWVACSIRHYQVEVAPEYRVTSSSSQSSPISLVQSGRSRRRLNLLRWITFVVGWLRCSFWRKWGFEYEQEAAAAVRRTRSENINIEIRTKRGRDKVFPGMPYTYTRVSAVLFAASLCLLF